MSLLMFRRTLPFHLNELYMVFHHSNSARLSNRTSNQPDQSAEPAVLDSAPKLPSVQSHHRCPKPSPVIIRIMYLIHARPGTRMHLPPHPPPPIPRIIPSPKSPPPTIPTRLLGSRHLTPTAPHARPKSRSCWCHGCCVWSWSRAALCRGRGREKAGMRTSRRVD